MHRNPPTDPLRNQLETAGLALLALIGTNPVRPERLDPALDTSLGALDLANERLADGRVPALEVLESMEHLCLLWLSVQNASPPRDSSLDQERLRTSGRAMARATLRTLGLAYAELGKGARA